MCVMYILLLSVYSSRQWPLPIEGVQCAYDLLHGISSLVKTGNWLEEETHKRMIQVINLNEQLTTLNVQSTMQKPSAQIMLGVAQLCGGLNAGRAEFGGRGSAAALHQHN